jgi:ATP-dependent DNA ligase
LLPSGGDWIFEPKWDGFRALVFRDGDEIFIQSRDEKPLNRYFPELLDPLRSHLPVRAVLDGEIVIVTGSGLDFDALQLRLHPAASRVERLARQNPASIVFFDLLAAGDRDLRAQPFRERRRALEKAFARAVAPIHLTPATRDPALAADWFRRFEGAGLDGVMAKPAEGIYEPDKRVMLKIKHERDCDCVVGGFRWHVKDPGRSVGSLLLGLYDDTGTLHHVGVCASFIGAKRRELAALLKPYAAGGEAGHPWAEAAVGQSRWGRERDLSWEPLRPELVVEVAYDHMQGNRFRHIAQFRRWRPDKRPRDCTFAQLEVIPPQELKAIFGR